MTAPTITTKIADGANTPITPSDVSGVLTAEVDYGVTTLRYLNLAGSVACYMYLSDEAGSLPVGEIGTTAANTNDKWELSTPLTFYAVAKDDATLGANNAIGDSTTDIAEVTVVMIADLNKIVRIDSFTLGLGNMKAYDFSKCVYATGGIGFDADIGSDSVGGVLGMFSANFVKSDLSAHYGGYYDKENKKIVLYKADGSQVAADTEVAGTVLLLRR